VKTSTSPLCRQNKTDCAVCALAEHVPALPLNRFMFVAAGTARLRRRTSSRTVRRAALQRTVSSVHMCVQFIV